MKAVAKIESDFDPKQRTGSYVGLFQLSNYEFAKYGSGDILNARDNAIAAAYMFATEAAIFELNTHKKATISDLYLIHQQGTQAAEEHVNHPDSIAWKSMCATDEGKQKGEKWCKRAIWGNTLPEIKQLWKTVDNLTSGAFVKMWRERAGRSFLYPLFRCNDELKGRVTSHFFSPVSDQIAEVAPGANPAGLPRVGWTHVQVRHIAIARLIYINSAQTGWEILKTCECRIMTNPIYVGRSALMTASARRGYATAFLVSLAMTTAAARPAAAAYWYGDGYGDWYGGRHKHRTAHKTHEPKSVDRADKEPFGQIQKGPLQIFISINQQKLHLYSDGVHVADTSIATGVPSLPTPLGVFSVIQRQVFHRSNIYSSAPMPFMQRITWSGVAMHEGESIGHRASHGCIRMPHDFAVRLYHLTRLNTRVIIANSELQPTEFADPHLFVHKAKPPEVAAPVANELEPMIAKPVELAVDANMPTSLVQSDAGTPQAAAPVVKPDQKMENAAPGADARPSALLPRPTATDLAKVAAAKQTPISIFISRKRQRLYVRQDFAPLFDTAVTIAQPDAPLGTHVFTALEFIGPEHSIMRWNVVSLPGEPPKRLRYVEERRDRHGRVRRREIEEERASDTPSPQNPVRVLARIEIPPEVSEAIKRMIIPGSSLIVSDQGLGGETGEGTDFIVVTR